MSDQLPSLWGHHMKVLFQFYPTQSLAEWEAQRWLRKKKIWSSHRSHRQEQLVLSGLLCRQTQQLLPPNKPKASIAHSDLLWMSLAFSPQDFYTLFPEGIEMANTLWKCAQDHEQPGEHKSKPQWAMASPLLECKTRDDRCWWGLREVSLWEQSMHWLPPALSLSGVKPENQNQTGNLYSTCTRWHPTNWATPARAVRSLLRKT